MTCTFRQRPVGQSVGRQSVGRQSVSLWAVLPLLRTTNLFINLSYKNKYICSLLPKAGGLRTTTTDPFFH